MSPEIPYVNFTDEIVYFTNTPALVQSFMTKFDDLWTSTTEFIDYANITAPLTRSYPVYAIDPDGRGGDLHVREREHPVASSQLPVASCQLPVGNYRAPN